MNERKKTRNKIHVRIRRKQSPQKGSVAKSGEKLGSVLAANSRYSSKFGDHKNLLIELAQYQMEQALKKDEPHLPELLNSNSARNDSEIVLSENLQLQQQIQRKLSAAELSLISQPENASNQ